MKILYSDHFLVPLPAGHRFPMPKYHLLRQKVFDSAIVSSEDLIEGPPASDEQILRVHTPDYLDKVKFGLLSEKEIRRIGLPWSSGLVERSRRSVGSTIAACQFALAEGIAANLAGGTHHAYPDHGEGYCVFNDIAIAIRDLQAERLARRFVILDLDVHQGNGTAAIFANDPDVFTFSIHGVKNFPYHKERSSLDIALPDGTGDAAYLEALQDGLAKAISDARAELAIYLAGADPFRDDRLGRLALSKGGLLARDQMIFAACQRAGIPVAITMSGGYARNIQDTADIHFQTIKLACSYHPTLTAPNNAASEEVSEL